MSIKKGWESSFLYLLLIIVLVFIVTTVFIYQYNIFKNSQVSKTTTPSFQVLIIYNNTKPYYLTSDLNKNGIQVFTTTPSRSDLDTLIEKYNNIIIDNVYFNESVLLTLLRELQNPKKKIIVFGRSNLLTSTLVATYNSVNTNFYRDKYKIDGLGFSMVTELGDPSVLIPDNYTCKISSPVIYGVIDPSKQVACYLGPILSFSPPHYYEEIEEDRKTIMKLIMAFFSS
jgi:hypothetical protein